MFVLGAGLACSTEWYPAQASNLELVAGVLLVGGLFLIGIGVDWALKPPFLAWP